MKLDVLKQQSPVEAATVPTMSDLPVSEKKDPHAGAIKNLAVVQCEGYRCLAYRDGEIWRDYQTGKELSEVKSVVHTFSV